MIVCEYTGFESFEQKDVYKRDMCLTANKKETPITTSRNVFLEPKSGARVRSGRFSENIPSKSQQLANSLCLCGRIYSQFMFVPLPLALSNCPSGRSKTQNCQSPKVKRRNSFIFHIELLPNLFLSMKKKSTKTRTMLSMENFTRLIQFDLPSEPEEAHSVETLSRPIVDDLWR